MTAKTDWGFQGFDVPSKTITLVSGEDMETAVEALREAGGGTLNLLYGPFEVNDLRIPPNVVIQSPIPTQARLVASVGAYSAIRPENGAGNIVLKNLSVRATGVTGNGIDFNRSHSNVLVEDVEIEGAEKTNLIFWNRTEEGEESGHITVRNCSSWGAKLYHGIAARGVKGIVIENCDLNGCGLEKGGYGLDFSHSSFIEVAECVVAHNAYGTKFPESTYIYFHDNQVTGNYDVGAKFQRPDSHVPLYVDMRDCTFVDNANSAAVDWSMVQGGGAVIVLKGNQYSGSPHNYFRAKSHDVWGFGEAAGPESDASDFLYKRRRSDEDPKSKGVGWETWGQPFGD